MPIIESFATIVALLGQFKSEKGAAELSDFNDFMDWLIKTNHQEIKDLLTINTKATIGIKAILNQDREILFAHLDKIDKALASFSSGIEGFSDLAFGIKPNSCISEQALEILKQFDKSGASKVLEHKSQGGSIYFYLDGPGGSMEISDPRFAEDDFNTLMKLGLLRHDFNSKGANMYLYTRLAASLVSGSDA
jgi:hypothetical protein